MRKIIILLILLFLCGCGVKVESVQMDKTFYQLGIEDEENLIFDIFPSEAKKSSIKWISSNNDVAIVKQGYLIGISEGECTIIGKSGNDELISLNVVVHTHQWDDVVRVFHHEEEGYFEAWDEVVIDKPAWDEIIVDKPAWDETILGREAWSEKVIVQEYIPNTYVKNITCTKCKRQGYDSQIGNKCISPTCGGTMVLHEYGSKGQEEISKIVHHDAEYKTIYHEAETHTIHHDAITHIVHHEEIRDKENYSNGNKNHWIVEVEAWDEDVVVGYKCKICNKTKDNLDGLRYYSQLNN